MNQKNKETPMISVIMSVFNGEKYLIEAVDSILCQTYSDFEFIIINDGSTDNTKEILETYQEKRLVILNNLNNIGLTKSLNKALSVAKGKYIARIDADDISLPIRIEKQVNFLNEHPDIGLIGGMYKKIDTMGRVIEIITDLPKEDLFIRWRLLHKNSFIHSCIMFRRGLVERNGFYDIDFKFSQDYELWSRLINYTKVANISDIITCQRVSKSNISNKYKKEQQNLALEVTKNNFNRLMGAEFVTAQEAQMLDNWFVKGTGEKIPSLYRNLCTKWVKTYFSFVKENWFDVTKNKNIKEFIIEKTIYGFKSFTQTPYLILLAPRLFLKYSRAEINKYGLLSFLIKTAKYIFYKTSRLKKYILRNIKILVKKYYCYRVKKIMDKIDFIFFPSNDTHVHWMIPIKKRLENAMFFVPSLRNEKADYFLKNFGIKFIKYIPGLMRSSNPKVLILGNDWGEEELKAIKEISLCGGKSVVIQEGCLDFHDDGIPRLQNADFAFLQGPIMKKYLDRDNLVVTGNPKFENQPILSFPNENLVMINANFTYGIYEDVREKWVNDVVDSCKKNDLDFFISQHPRDKGVFPGNWPITHSNAFKIEDQLSKSSIFVSRFSTVIYEAVCMGRYAIYYNPHGEPFKIFNEDKSGGILIARSKDELADYLKYFSKGGKIASKNQRKFLENHCNLNNKIGSVILISQELEKIRKAI